MDVVIIGAGGYGRELLDVLREMAARQEAVESLRFVGFIDDGSPDAGRLARIDARHLGGSERLGGLGGAGYVVGIADPQVRERLAAAADSAGLEPVTLIHPSCTIGRDVEVGAGSALSAGVRLTTNIRIGRHVLLNQGVTVGHDSTCEDFVTVNPQGSISGDVLLRRGATVGTTASVNQGLEVGAYAMVGAGAAVVRPVEPETAVVGVPARPLQSDPGAERS